jgi:hypothetical protein
VLEERAFFDTFPANDGPTFHGTWSNYPYFASGTIAVTGIDEGLFLLKVSDAVLDAHETRPVSEEPPGEEPPADGDNRSPRGEERGNPDRDERGKQRGKG